MSFVITGLPSEPFEPLFGLSDGELAAAGVVRRVADAKPGFPCRVTLEDAEPGETVLLLNYEHQPAETPYRASHAIFVREAARGVRRAVDEIPPALSARKFVSLRAFDRQGMMVGAEVAPGDQLEPAIARRLADPAAAYVHAHNAAHGCYLARIERQA